MIEDVKKEVKKLLGSGRVKGFMGLCETNGHIGPHLFCDENDLDHLVVGDWKQPGDSRYPLNKQVIHLARSNPEDTFGVLVRGCDERGLKTLSAWNQLDPNRIISVGIACPPELAEACECLQPYPDEFVAGEKAEACSSGSVAQMDHLDLAGRFAHWMNEFSKCIKCYGCREICPMCFCKECSLENDDLIHTGEIPPEIPLFHLINRDPLHPLSNLSQTKLLQFDKRWQRIFSLYFIIFSLNLDALFGWKHGSHHNQHNIFHLHSN